MMKKQQRIFWKYYLKNENYNVIKYYSSTDVVRDIDDLKIDLAILDVYDA